MIEAKYTIASKTLVVEEPVIQLTISVEAARSLRLVTGSVSGPSARRKQHLDPIWEALGAALIAAGVVPLGLSDRSGTVTLHD
jgi:hypothetical protein